MLTQKGRIQLNIPLEQWVRRALIEVSYLNLCHLIPEIAILSAVLPNYGHLDPADRIIIATAMHHKAILVTGDLKIIV